VRTQ